MRNSTGTRALNQSTLAEEVDSPLTLHTVRAAKGHRTKAASTNTRSIMRKDTHHNNLTADRHHITPRHLSSDNSHNLRQRPISSRIR